NVSPTGDRVVLTARGQVFVVPAQQGRIVEATRDKKVRYREGRFFPDGKSLLALSDQTGEVEFWKVPANGVGDSAQRTARSCAGTVFHRPTARGSRTSTKTSSSGCTTLRPRRTRALRSAAK